MTVKWLKEELARLGDAADDLPVYVCFTTEYDGMTADREGPVGDILTVHGGKLWLSASDQPRRPDGD